MKHFTIVTGICAVLLIATIFVAGCASSSDAPAAGTGAVTQNTQSIAPTPAGGVSLQLTRLLVRHRPIREPRWTVPVMQERTQRR